MQIPLVRCVCSPLVSACASVVGSSLDAFEAGVTCISTYVMRGQGGEETSGLLTIVSKDLIDDCGEETTALWTIGSKDLIGYEQEPKVEVM